MGLREFLKSLSQQRNIPVTKFDDGRQPEIFDQPPILEGLGKWKPVEVGNYHQISEKKSYTPALDLAIEFLKANPDLKISNREIARQLGISHPVVGEAKKALKNG